MYTLNYSPHRRIVLAHDVIKNCLFRLNINTCLVCEDNTPL